MTQILAIIGSVLGIVIGFWKYFRRKDEARRKLAVEAKEKLKSAKKNDSVSDLLDAFDRVRE